MWYVYILQCSDKSFYTGVAQNLDQRVSRHNAGKGAKYTRARQPVELVYSETLLTKKRALAREDEIKKLSQKNKKKLIVEGGFPRG